MVTIQLVETFLWEVVKHKINYQDASRTSVDVVQVLIVNFE